MVRAICVGAAALSALLRLFTRVMPQLHTSLMPLPPAADAASAADTCCHYAAISRLCYADTPLDAAYRPLLLSPYYADIRCRIYTVIAIYVAAKMPATSAITPIFYSAAAAKAIIDAGALRLRCCLWRYATPTVRPPSQCKI